MKKVSFHINKNFDKFMAGQFLNEKGGGIDFGTAIVKMHPGLRPAKKNRDLGKNVISEYFDTYYAEHGKEMATSIKIIRRGWGEIERKYVETTEKIFDGYHFPRGEYAAYASILNCNPRFLDSKTFQLFYKKNEDDALHTIAHELLHFIFFDFVEKKMKKDVSKLSAEELWDLSEIFNVIVLRSPAYGDIIDRKYVRPYPYHEKYIRSFEIAYKRSRNIRSFISRGITII